MLAADGCYRLLEAADPGLGNLHRLEAPAVQRRIFLIHAEENGGEERRLLAAGAGAQLEDGVALVGLVPGQEHEADLALEIGQALFERGKLGRGESAHFRIDLGRIGSKLARERCRILVFRPDFLQSLNCFDERREIGIFLGQPGKIAAELRRIGQRMRELRMAPHHAVELSLERGLAHLASASSRNRRRSRSSMRAASPPAPARSRSASDGACRRRATRSRVAASASKPCSAITSSRTVSKWRRSATTAGTAARAARRVRNSWQLLLDDAPGGISRSGAVRAAGKRGALEIGEIVKEDAVERVDRRIGVGRKSHIDDEDGPQRTPSQ